MKKNFSLTVVSFLLFFAGFFLTCKKTDRANVSSNRNVDLTTKVTASVSGFVTNEFDNPLPGAKIIFGSSTTTSDQYGYFEIKNTEVVQDAQVVTVSSSGYFKGIKTFITSANNSSFTRVKLIPKSSSGTISASSGGSIALLSGMKVSLSPNSVMNAATKQPYTGTVNVSVFYIDPTGEDLDEIMPGNLSGLDNSKGLKILTSFGMAAVEMTDNSGELLQINEGKTATLTIPISPAILGNAPSSIPLWYFDENRGLWNEQGTAVKTGNTYVGEVSHFSYWNCDIPGDVIQVRCTITNSQDQPLSNIPVKVTRAGYSSSAYGYTNGNGELLGNVPANAQLKLNIKLSGQCSVTLAQGFSTSNANISLGRLAVPSDVSTSVITGSVIDCNNLPVTNGCVYLVTNNQFSMYPLEADGKFNVTVLRCGNITSSTLFVEDKSKQQQSMPQTYSITNGTNSVGNITACGTSTEEYSNLDINGQKYMLGPYANGTFMSGGGLYGDRTQFNPTLVKLKNGVYVKNSDHIQWGMSYRTNPYNLLDSNYVIYFGLYAGADEGYKLLFYHTYDQNTPVKVNLTEYGPVGGFISGTIDGTLYNRWGGIPTNIPYKIAYQFRFRRLN